MKVYHVTYRNNLDSIMSNGLEPSTDSVKIHPKIGHYSVEPGYIYVFKNFNRALSAAEEDPATGDVILEIDIPYQVVERDYDQINFYIDVAAEYISPRVMFGQAVNDAYFGNDYEKAKKLAKQESKQWSQEEWNNKFGQYRIKGHISPDVIKIVSR